MSEMERQGGYGSSMAELSVSCNEENAREYSHSAGNVGASVVALFSNIYQMIDRSVINATTTFATSQHANTKGKVKKKKTKLKTLRQHMYVENVAVDKKTNEIFPTNKLKRVPTADTIPTSNCSHRKQRERRREKFVGFDKIVEDVPNIEPKASLNHPSFSKGPFWPTKSTISHPVVSSNSGSVKPVVSYLPKKTNEILSPSLHGSAKSTLPKPLETDCTSPSFLSAPKSAKSARTQPNGRSPKINIGPTKETSNTNCTQQMNGHLESNKPRCNVYNSSNRKIFSMISSVENDASVAASDLKKKLRVTASHSDVYKEGSKTRSPVKSECCEDKREEVDEKKGKSAALENTNCVSKRAPVSKTLDVDSESEYSLKSIASTKSAAAVLRNRGSTSRVSKMLNSYAHVDKSKESEKRESDVEFEYERATVLNDKMKKMIPYDSESLYSVKSIASTKSAAAVLHERGSTTAVSKKLEDYVGKSTKIYTHTTDTNNRTRNKTMDKRNEKCTNRSISTSDGSIMSTKSAATVLRERGSKSAVSQLLKTYADGSKHR